MCIYTYGTPEFKLTTFQVLCSHWQVAAVLITTLAAQLVKNLPLQSEGRPGFDPWVGTVPGKELTQPLRYSCKLWTT